MNLTKARLLAQRPSTLVQETIELCEIQATEEQAKVAYVLDLFDTSGAEELREKANQGK